MATTHSKSDRCTVAEYNSRLSHLLEGRMDIRKYKILKAALVTGLILLFGTYAIYAGADPTTTAWMALAGALLVNGFEIGEFVTVQGSNDEE